MKMTQSKTLVSYYFQYFNSKNKMVGINLQTGLLYKQNLMVNKEDINLGS